MSDLKDT